MDWAQSSMEKDIGDSKTPKKPSRLVDKQVDDLLKAGFGGGHDKEYETRATDVQMAFERWVSASEDVSCIQGNQRHRQGLPRLARTD